jgi:hypothetical protein
MTDDPREILLSYAARISAAVVDCLGKDRVESVFLSGGVARNEVAAFRGPYALEIYSDLDLFVVARTADLEKDRGRVRRAVSAIARTGENYAILPEPDVGVFSETDFLGQKTRPGTVEIAEANIMLVGGGAVPARFGKFKAAEIDPSEALYLLENRLREIAGLAVRLERGENESFRRYVRYVLLKSCLDAGTAVVIVMGCFHPSRRERMKVLRRERGHGVCHRLLPESAFSRLEECHDRLANLQELLRSDPGPDSASIREAGAFLLDTWRRTCELLTGYKTIGWNALFEWRCKSGRWIGNAREISILARRRSISRAKLLGRARRLARLSPVDALRLAGAAGLLEAGERRGGGPAVGQGPLTPGYTRFIDELTRVFGYDDGDPYERARRMYEESA